MENRFYRTGAGRRYPRDGFTTRPFRQELHPKLACDYTVSLASTRACHQGGDKIRRPCGGFRNQSVIIEEPMTNSLSDAFVFFGATGDLAHKKIFPSLQSMIKDGVLDVPVIGVAKSGWTLAAVAGARPRRHHQVRRRRGRGRLQEAVRADGLHRRRLRRRPDLRHVAYQAGQGAVANALPGDSSHDVPRGGEGTGGSGDAPRTRA